MNIVMRKQAVLQNINRKTVYLKNFFIGEGDTFLWKNHDRRLTKGEKGGIIRAQTNV